MLVRPQEGLGGEPVAGAGWTGASCLLGTDTLADGCWGQDTAYRGSAERLLSPGLSSLPLSVPAPCPLHSLPSEHSVEEEPSRLTSHQEKARSWVPITCLPNLPFDPSVLLMFTQATHLTWLMHLLNIFEILSNLTVNASGFSKMHLLARWRPGAMEGWELVTVPRPCFSWCQDVRGSLKKQEKDILNTYTEVVFPLI